jgi:NitT/TauT family transport system permease protein
MPFKVVRALVFYAALIGLWQLVYKAGIWSPYLFPSPASVYHALERVVNSGLLLDSVVATMRRMAIGFSIAFVIGITLGVTMAMVRWVDETLGTIVLGLLSLPSITWLPMAVLWFGLSERAIIFVVLMGSIFAIAISARDGVRNIPPIQRRTAQVFGANRWQTYRYVVLPGMLPSMVQGLKLGWSFSWRSLMAGELLFVSLGLGRLLETGRDLNQMNLVIAIMLVIVAIGLGVNRVIFGPLESWVRERWGLADTAYA